jgi:hypothetical protein
LALGLTVPLHAAVTNATADRVATAESRLILRDIFITPSEVHPYGHRL